MVSALPDLLVEARTGSYPVVIAPAASARAGEFARLLANGSRVLVVCDHNTAEIAGNRVALDAGAEILELEPGEGSKSFHHLESVCAAAAEHGLDRGSVIVAVGGGVIGDLAGTAAALYLRGVRFVQVPTNVLAMVDSSIGGKVGVNLPAGKNLVGAFKPPEAVFIDPDLLSGLPDREFRGGMAEVIKSGLIADVALLELLERETARILKRDGDVLLEMLARTCAVKVGVVSRDETEGGERAILNYGHTVAHALEAASGFSPGLSHGEAVAVGMGAAARVGLAVGVTPRDVIPVQERLLRAYGLPLTSPIELEADAVMAAMSHDKKAVAGRIRWVLLDRLGQASWGHLVEPDVVREAVRAAL